MKGNRSQSLRRVAAGAFAAAVIAGGAIVAGGAVVASDHDDGELEIKGRNVGLTDLFVFREGDQTGVAADNDNLIFIMNTNERSLARQQYFYSSVARYNFNVTRIADVDDAAPGRKDVILRFEFDIPDANGRQAMTVTAIKDGQTFKTTERSDNGAAILTTTLEDDDNGNDRNNPFELDGEQLTVFAGLREDPFFFDVEQFFRVRAGALGTGPAVGFRDATEAIDFAVGYNVLSTVVRVPITFLQSGANETVFDVWEDIEIPDPTPVIR